MTTNVYIHTYINIYLNIWCAQHRHYHYSPVQHKWLRNWDILQTRKKVEPLSRTRLSASKWPWLWLLPGIFHGVWAPHLYGKHIGKKAENRIDTGPRCLMFFWTDALYCLKMDYTVLDFVERWLEKNISLFVYGRTAMMLGNNFAIICMNRLPAKKQQPALLNPSAKVVSDTGLLHK